MKLAMKLRTRLFLSISALITVALLGLLLGLVSVMQMAGTQEALIRNNFVTLDLGLKLRQTLGDQLIIMLSDETGSVRRSRRPGSITSSCLMKASPLPSRRGSFSTVSGRPRRTT